MAPEYPMAIVPSTPLEEIYCVVQFVPARWIEW